MTFCQLEKIWLAVRSLMTIDAVCVSRELNRYCIVYGNVGLRKTFEQVVILLLEELMDRISGEELELFLVQCWVIWNQRNAFYMGESCKTHRD